jgi:hypothetical protein
MSLIAMGSIGMWLCVLVGTALLGAAGWAAMNYYGIWAKKRDEMEREKLAAEWKRRAAERKAQQEGRSSAATGGEEETGDNPPLY